MRSVIPRLRTVPTLPAAHQRIVETLRDPNHSGDDLARLMSRDLSHTTNLFKSANSAAFGLSQPVSTVAEAISHLGVERLQALVMSAWAFQFIADTTCPGFNPRQEWEHALAVASATRDLSAQIGTASALAETAFTAGMLHDLGKLLLAANAPDAYRLILAEAAEANRPIWQVEQEGMGFTHAELGACMLGIWGLALPVVEAVAWHHRPADAANSQPSPLMLVHLADCKVRNLPPDPAHAKLAGLC